MQTLKVDFSKPTGKIKPVNAVNNGPAGSRTRRTGNFDLYESLHIPYARLHDSAFYNGNYGGEYSVDVHRVFPDFDADENDPASYLFGPTDAYLQDIEAAGTKIYYRLGAAIEHGHKRGTYPPKDFAKWARICEHIIMHYTQGWANGFHMDIEYWEIWNEPDCTNADGSHPCWQGTPEQFIEFFITAITYLKGKFPALKFGGPAICWVKDPTYMIPLLESMQKVNAPLDFFSFHGYTKEPKKMAVDIAIAKELLERYGYSGAEMHLNEWNYVRSFLGKEFEFSIKSIKGAYHRAQ